MSEADNEIFESVVQGFDTIEQRGKQDGESGTSGSLPQEQYSPDGRLRIICYGNCIKKEAASCF